MRTIFITESSTVDSKQIFDLRNLINSVPFLGCLFYNRLLLQKSFIEVPQKVSIFADDSGFLNWNEKGMPWKSATVPAAVSLRMSNYTMPLVCPGRPNLMR